MKLYTVVFTEHIRGRAPHGARGLKHECFGTCEVVAESRPAWGAWIETVMLPGICHAPEVAPHTGRVD